MDSNFVFEHKKAYQFFFNSTTLKNICVVKTLSFKNIFTFEEHSFLLVSESFFNVWTSLIVILVSLYFSNKSKSFFFTIEKGGKAGEVLVSLSTYKELEQYLNQFDKFKINRQAYYNDIKQSLIISKENCEASHGFRWNFAKRRMFEYGKAGFKYEECLQQVSYEMKHNRASITKHYLA